MGTKLALYIALPSVDALLRDSRKFDALVSLLKRLGFEKVYLENYRDGKLLSEGEMARVRDMFEKEFRVAGGVAIGTWGPGMGRNADFWSVCACIDDERNVGLFEKAVVQQAKVFDEVLIDDFWANWCYSNEGVEYLNKSFGVSLTLSSLRRLLMVDDEVRRLWSEYSKTLLANVSRRIYNSAKAVNNNVRVVLKVAEWREHFLHRGLDLPLMAKIFDGIYVGTESREGTKRFGSLFIIDYVRAFVGEKLRGAWFDSYNGLGIPTTMAPETFEEQLWYSFLGKVDEITFFQGTEYIDFVVDEYKHDMKSLFILDESRREHIAHVERSLPLLRSVENLLTEEKIGVVSPAIQPTWSDPYDGYIEDVLGSMGIPLTAKPIDKLRQGDVVLVKRHVLRYVDIFDLLRKGVNIVLTAAATESIARGALGYDAISVVGADMDEPILHSVVEAVAFTDGKTYADRSHRRPYVYAFGPVLKMDRSASIRVLLYGVDERGWKYPAIYVVDHGNAKVVVATITRNSLAYLHQFPEIARQALRDALYSFIGVKIESRARDPNSNETSDIAVVVYRSRSIALVNNNLYNNYLGLVVNKKMLGISNFAGFELGAAKAVDAEDVGEEIRIGIKIARHSFDLIKFE
ncbi:MAG: hypothetical protein QXG81_07355 [Ignisphaera sp.]